MIVKLDIHGSNLEALLAKSHAGARLVAERYGCCLVHRGDDAYGLVVFPPEGTHIPKIRDWPAEVEA